MRYMSLLVLVVLLVVALAEIKINVYGTETNEEPSQMTDLNTFDTEELDKIEEIEEVEEPKVITAEDIIIDYSLFDDAIFVGNSRTQGLFWYSDLDATEYTYQGLTVDSIHSAKVIKQNGYNITIADAIKNNKDFKTVYIMMGTNELGWKVRPIFIERYEKIIDMILETNPTCTIYVQSILPVCERISVNDKVFNMTNINEFNELIKDMCERKNITYIDITSILLDEHGYLPEEASSDGIHLNKLYCRKWLKYLENYASKEE